LVNAIPRIKENTTIDNILACVKAWSGFLGSMFRICSGILLERELDDIDSCVERVAFS